MVSLKAKFKAWVGKYLNTLAKLPEINQFSSIKKMLLRKNHTRLVALLCKAGMKIDVKMELSINRQLTKVKVVREPGNKTTTVRNFF